METKLSDLEGLKKKEMDYLMDYTMSGGADDGEDGIGLCGWLLTAMSWIIVLVTLPFSLFFCFKVVQEYERAVIFRLGRLLQGGSKGPGIFFVLPCIESYQKVDLRTITLDVPPQEVDKNSIRIVFKQNSCTHLNKCHTNVCVIMEFLSFVCK